MMLFKIRLDWDIKNAISNIPKLNRLEYRFTNNQSQWSMNVMTRLVQLLWNFSKFVFLQFICHDICCCKVSKLVWMVKMVSTFDSSASWVDIRRCEIESSDIGLVTISQEVNKLNKCFATKYINLLPTYLVENIQKKPRNLFNADY